MVERGQGEGKKENKKKKERISNMRWGLKFGTILLVVMLGIGLFCTGINPTYAEPILDQPDIILRNDHLGADVLYMLGNVGDIGITAESSSYFYLAEASGVSNVPYITSQSKPFWRNLFIGLGVSAIGAYIYAMDHITASSSEQGGKSTPISLPESTVPYVVPEPSTVILLGSGLIGLGVGAKAIKKRSLKK